MYEAKEISVISKLKKKSALGYFYLSLEIKEIFFFLNGIFCLERSFENVNNEKRKKHEIYQETKIIVSNWNV